MDAIIPAAGKGQRMFSLTHGEPKELLRVGGRAVLDWVVDEAVGAGAREVVVVSSPLKPDLDKALEDRAPIRLAHQLEALGLAHAIAAGLPVDAPALVLLPDTIFHPSGPSAAIARALETADAVVAVETVADEDVHRYGIVELDGELVVSILEKPMPEQTASRMAVAARYGLGPRMIEILAESVADFGGEGEIDLTSVLNRGISAGLRVVTVPIGGGVVRFDCGSPEGYARAVEALGG